MSNTAWVAILVVVLAGLTYFAWRSNRPRFLVVACHNAVWAGALILIGTNLIAYKESSASAWLTLASGIVFFNVGAWIAKWPVGSWWPFKRLRRTKTAPAPLNPGASTALFTRFSVIVACAVYAAAFGFYLVNISSRFGLVTLLTSPATIRGYRGESYLESVPFLIRVFLYLGPLLFVAFGYKASVDRPFPIWMRIAALVLLTGSMLALLQRTNLFMAVLWLIAVLVTQPSSKSETISEPAIGREKRSAGKFRPLGGRGRIVIAIVAFVVVAFVAFQVVGGALHKNGQQALSTGAVSAPLESSGLTSPFTYYTAGTVAFLQLVDSPNHEWPPPRAQGSMVVGNYNPQTWGASTFGPIFKAIPGASALNTIQPFIDTAVLTNVYTWLEPYYRDFRTPGVVLAMFLMGLLVARMYSRRFESARLFWMQSAFISTIFLATFLTKINNTLFLSELIFVFFLAFLRPGNHLSERWRWRRTDDNASMNGVASSQPSKGTDTDD